MTGAALRLCVLAAQRVLGLPIMIEDRDTPILFDVAALALVTKPALVSLLVIVLAMARNTSALELVSIEISGMTARALGQAMLAAQRIPGIAIMIEADGLPFTVDVTALALLAEASLVSVFLVILAVAGDAARGRPLEFGVLVAITATDVLVLAGKREAGLAVIEGRVFPARITMAVRAVVAELALVRVVLAMTGNTV